MKNKFIATRIFVLLFVALIILVECVNVAPIGPEGTSIGLSSLNGGVRQALGANDTWYKITEVLGYLSIASVGVFVLFGLYQAIRRKSLLKVDKKLFALLGLYCVTVLAYLAFEVIVINYRPVIMPGDAHVEASFPSSHTLLSCVIMGSAYVMIDHYVKNRGLRIALQYVCLFMATIITVGRLLSGVHWFTDILGGVFLSVALVTLFAGICNAVEKKDKE